MTAPPTDWPAVGGRVDIDEEAAGLARRFPGVAVWFGAATRRWWALVGSTGRWHLVEAGDPHDLSQLIASARAVSSRPGNQAVVGGGPDVRALAREVRPVTAPVRAVTASPPEPRRRSSGRHARV